MQRDLTSGSIFRNLIRFSIPYLISCFLQTFYGLADLFITGQFNGAASISAVSVGSQVMHMVTVAIVGLAMGSTVLIGRSIGAKDTLQASKSVGNSVTVFALFAAAFTILMFCARMSFIRILSVPEEAVRETEAYLAVCIAGIPFIVAYNFISSIFRGLGDTKSPMIFVLIAGIFNVVLDVVLIGPLHMGAAGAALATTGSQAVSVVIALLTLTRMKTGIRLTRSDFVPDGRVVKNILSVGIPIACQDGLIQVSFLVITTIANTRGLSVSAAVGIVEKLISFIFLVPSAMSASITALAAHNIGAGRHDRALQTLKYALGVCAGYAAVVIVLCELFPAAFVGLFTKGEPEVLALGCQYLRTYAVDALFAGIHFCFSGYFCAYNRAAYSFIHNIISIAVCRIPGALLATCLYPTTLYALGLAAPIGSFLSILICALLYRNGRRKGYWNGTVSDSLPD